MSLDVHAMVQRMEMELSLIHISILDRLCGPLCDAITQPESGRPDGQARLEQLVADNLFLLPLDEERRWFRYHRLFADLSLIHI